MKTTSLNLTLPMNATAHTNAADLLNEVTKMGFVPARWDTPDTRILDVKNSAGHINLRICINYEGGTRPLNVDLIKFDGARSRVTKGESCLSAYMPLAAIISLIEASI